MDTKEEKKQDPILDDAGDAANTSEGYDTSSNTSSEDFILEKLSEEMPILSLPEILGRKLFFNNIIEVTKYFVKIVSLRTLMKDKKQRRLFEDIFQNVKAEGVELVVPKSEKKKCFSSWLKKYLVFLQPTEPPSTLELFYKTEVSTLYRDKGLKLIWKRKKCGTEYGERVRKTRFFVASRFHKWPDGIIELLASQKKQESFSYSMPDVGCSLKKFFALRDFSLITNESTASKKEIISPLTLTNVLSQALKGLLALHQAGFIHADVKPGNIVYDPSRGLVTIVDWELSAVNCSEEYVLTKKPVWQGRFHQSFGPDSEPFGTVDFYSPEQIAQTHITSKVDLFGLGLTTLCLIKKIAYLRKQSTPGARKADLLALISCLSSLEVKESQKYLSDLGIEQKECVTPYCWREDEWWQFSNQQLQPTAEPGKQKQLSQNSQQSSHSGLSSCMQKLQNLLHKMLAINPRTRISSLEAWKEMATIHKSISDRLSKS